MANVQVSVDEALSVPLEAERIRRAVEAVLQAEAADGAEISVALVGDEQISSLNQDYLHHDGPTDVIAFPLHHPGQPALGDVYVGVPQAARQAAELGVPLDEEILRLAVHGTLHVLGYDHPADATRDDSAMYRRQEALLAAFLRSGGQSR